MILSHVNSYLKQHRRASVTDMALAFESSPEALKEMLGVLERKGRIRRLPSGTACGGGCNKCAPDSVEIYEWVGEQPIQLVR